MSTIIKVIDVVCRWCCLAYSGAPINTEATTTTTETTPETTTPPVTVSTTTAGQGSTSWVEYPSDNGEAASSAASLGKSSQ